MLRSPYGKVALLCALALSSVAANVSSEAAQRTFVASYGSDSNNCAIGAPCRSFATAMTHTDTDGEIIVLDSAGYGRVTIDRSVAIIAPPGVYAGISVFAATNGVDINGAGIVVVLRGLTINGQGGTDGISFVQGARLYIEQCVVSNMGSAGIVVATGETYITDSTIRNNLGGGIQAESTLDLVIDRTRIERNGGPGLSVLNGPRATVTNSVIVRNGSVGGIAIRADDGVSQTVVTVTDSNVSQNGSQGIIAQAVNAGSIVRLAASHNTVSRNGGTGVYMTASGTLTAVVTDNTIVRNGDRGGIYAAFPGVSATIGGNAVSGNNLHGVEQSGNALLRTSANNIIRDNTTDIAGMLTVVAGD